MINYVAHWNRILIQSRSEIISELHEYNFRAICPDSNTTEIKNHYTDVIDWKISRRKFFDLKSIFNLKKILDSLDNGSTVHVFTLKSGFIFMIAYFFSKKNLNSILSVTGLGYLFSNRLTTKFLRILVRPVFVKLINKTFKNIIYQNISDENIFNSYANFKNKSHLIESSGLQVNQYEVKETFNKQLKIIMASRLLEDKGIENYLNLASKLKSSKFKFYLAGELDEGNPKTLNNQQLKDIVNNDCIEYLGHIDLKKELKNYDLLISLSEHEGFSRVLLEAIYVGLYCIAYKNSGTSFIEDFSNTKTISSKDLEIYINEIEKIYKSEKDISHNNRQSIIEKYSTKIIANSFDTIYRMKD